MSSARLTALRLVGFKSFAERTLVEFGPGISAIVGPNGSGKSNLADALRWTLGEQGRSLRARRSEDVIFAGSSARRAIGMADVTLVIDNHDRLLPVDFGEVEIGRRLYRSGENEYMINRQRIRLRDLVDLLDAGNLADNAFLFIGQGMVDQALALRPEERRPLFEEAAGVRRHERRRRQAEAELVEAESNLERLRDVLGELRPQARRLAAQAEQLQARRTAGVELAEALLAAARARWEASAEVARREQGQLEAARAAADSALAELRSAEEDATAISTHISERAATEHAQRAILDRQRAEIVELRVAQARIESELSALERDRARIADQRAAAEERIRAHGQALSVPRPEPDGTLAHELGELTRRLDEQTASGGAPASSNLAALRSDLAARSRRLDELARSLAEGNEQLANLTERLATEEKDRDEAVRRLARAGETEKLTQSSLDAARSAVDSAAAGLSQGLERLAATDADAAAARARLMAIEAALEAGADQGLVRAMRARGATLVAEGLEVEPRFRKAVSAALGPAGEAFSVDGRTALAVAGRRGSLVVNGSRPSDGKTTAATEAAISAAVAMGGGPLVEGIRRDPGAEVTRLLRRSVWVPNLAAALQVQPALPNGWQAVTVDGELVDDQGIVRLAGDRSDLELRVELEEQIRSLTELDERLAALRLDVERRTTTRDAAAKDLRGVQEAVEAARRERRSAEEAERVAQRRADQLLREITWEQAQVDRLATEKEGTEAAVSRLEAEVHELEEGVDGGRSARGADSAVGAAAKEAELRDRHNQLMKARSAEAARLDAWHEARRTAEVGRAMDDARLQELDAEAQRIVDRGAELEGEQIELAARQAEAEGRERESAAELDALLTAGADDRARLLSAERAATEAREKLRTAEAGNRHSEVAAMEARLQLEQLREQLLVELAGIGRDGLVSLLRAAGESGEATDDEAQATGALESALDAVVLGWSKERADESAPSAGRLAALRRRFHDLGASNPFAVEEYAELSDRLTTLEAQRADLESAIDSTRELIASLSALINDQFRRTFAALEDAFARRFEELFGGGDAQLSLTAPDDLSTTGIEIHARPPGKKRQPLAMLSGGERALTAVSLLLAMLEVRPVPFCVLDEVDAALDEANIARFSGALRGLAEQTQFIVITHNRGTIEAADALYGVTIGDDAVSRVISLRLPNENGAAADSQELVVEEAAARS